MLDIESIAWPLRGMAFRSRAYVPHRTIYRRSGSRDRVAATLPALIVKVLEARVSEETLISNQFKEIVLSLFHPWPFRLPTRLPLTDVNVTLVCSASDSVSRGFAAPQPLRWRVARHDDRNKWIGMLRLSGIRKMDRATRVRKSMLRQLLRARARAA